MGKRRRISLGHTKILSSPAADSHRKVLEDPFEKSHFIFLQFMAINSLRTSKSKVTSELSYQISSDRPILQEFV